MKLTEKQKLRKRLKTFCVMMGEQFNNLDADLVSRLEDTIYRLGTPTKVAIAGLSGSQHRAVGEFFIGDQLFASAEEAKSCPAIEIRYGKEAKTEAIFGDTHKTYPGLSLSVALAGKKPDAVRVQLPHAIFAEIDFTLLPAYDGDDNRAGYLVTLLDNTEVIVWCSDATGAWLPQERRLWFTVPDTLKERSILALTSAERLSTDEAKSALMQKLDFVSGEFHTSAKLNVDLAKASVRAGGVVNPEQFAASGGQTLLKHVMALVQMGQVDLMIQARALRSEIDTIPIGSVEEAPVMPLSELVPVTEPTPAVAEQSPESHAESLLLQGTKRCQETLSECGANNFGPLFEALSETLSSLTKVMTDGLALERDQDLMVKQLDEATEITGLLSYENNEKAAVEAADIYRQIALDIWSRLPANSVSGTRNLTEFDKVSA